MTERQWQACADPGKLLGAVGTVGTTYRKARLFCCAYCRCFFWDHLPPGVRDAIEVAEAYADQAVSKYKLRKARDTFHSAGTTTNAEWRANLVAQLATSPSDPFQSARMLLENRNTLPWKGGKKAIAPLIREIFGYPFGPATPIAASVLAWNDATVPRLARAAYGERHLHSGTLDAARLAVLADALKDAACEDEALVRHCRGEGPHVRGCWAVDLILGNS